MRYVTVIGLVILVVTAGCTSLSPTNADASEPNAITYPSGYSNETINASTAKQTHLSQGQAAGSVTVNTTIHLFSSTTAGLLKENLTATESVYVNDTTNRYYAVRNGSLRHREEYQKPNADSLYTYNPNETGERAFASRGAYENVTNNLTPRVDKFPVFAVIDRLNYNQTSVDREKRTITYTATSFTTNRSGAGRLAPLTPRDARNVTSTVVVDEQGRLQSFDVTGDVHSTCFSCEDSYQYTMTLRATFENYGKTTVPQPDWVDEATKIIDD